MRRREIMRYGEVMQTGSGCQLSTGLAWSLQTTPCLARTHSSPSGVAAAWDYICDDFPSTFITEGRNAESSCTGLLSLSCVCSMVYFFCWFSFTCCFLVDLLSCPYCLVVG